MKRGLKITIIILAIIVILGLVAFGIDYTRAKEGKKPIFCIQHPGGVIMDGGTIEYFGLGYKVIDFHTLAGFDDVKIGTWVMKYEDFNEEIKSYEEKYEEQLWNNMTAEMKQKGYEFFGEDYCTTDHSLEVGGDALTEWKCKLCGTSAINPDTNVPKLCRNCAQITGRCYKCGKVNT